MDINTFEEYILHVVIKIQIWCQDLSKTIISSYTWYDILIIY